MRVTRVTGVDFTTVIAGDWATGTCAPDGADGVKIEITGCAHLWGGEAALAADLAARLARRRIACRIAVADTLGAAWGLARFAAGNAAAVRIR